MRTSEPSDPIDKVLGVLLAGGQARRMGGGDKCLLELGGKSLLAHTLERIHGSVDALILNAPGDPERFSDFGLEVVGDVIDGFAGPLAGVLTGLEWAAQNREDIHWVATFATDAPFIPTDLVARLKAAIIDEGADMACAASNGRVHPVFALWPVAARQELRDAMIDEDIRKVDLWTSRYKLARVEYSTDPFDPFLNINTPEDLIEGERHISPGPGSL